MIKAKKSQIFSTFFHIYNSYLLKKSFQDIYIFQQEPISLTNGTLILVNHSSWWDGLLSFHLSKTVLDGDHYVMMSEAGLQRYSFFRKLGAFSISLQSLHHIKESLTYATTLLQNRKTLWLFPQGEEQHLEKRPLLFKKGAAHLVYKQEVQIIPITFYYSFGHTRKPNVYIYIGSPLHSRHLHNMSVKEMTSWFEKIITSQLNIQRESIIHEATSNYDMLLRGYPSLKECLFKEEKHD
ncbi:lysophospholipid acyltransferase family protein [Alkalihalobacillus sp. LMS39]|uniref:lysophospholipid acyltransferase family protein n=1 Tax=Alkalihalobacillus sp. LMS39 TaxID=2924032 RepID=UPI001FB39D1A|nr:lysophospholipid acyltransferase family protein [Alkalihalobacillus sp. LMS39]UOE96104.1 lysophospholipid acyltransferase family protein [Alkalihalobacillus sp. LMS39]